MKRVDFPRRTRYGTGFVQGIVESARELGLEYVHVILEAWDPTPPPFCDSEGNYFIKRHPHPKLIIVDIGVSIFPGDLSESARSVKLLDKFIKQECTDDTILWVV